jgi:hypothetical protein
MLFSEICYTDCGMGENKKPIYVSQAMPAGPSEEGWLEAR